MSNRNIKLLAVDLDGTLVDSAPDIAHCLDRALEATGFEPPGETLTRSWIGDGLETLIARALTHSAATKADAAKQHGPAMTAFLACYSRHLFIKSTLYPGAVAVLDRTLEAGIRLCCITNKRSGFSEELLEHAGVRNRFELVLGGDSLPEKKPSPLPLTTAAERLGVPPSACTLLGDSHQDARAARAAGYGFIWAAYGYGKLDPGELGDAPELGALVNLPALLGI